MAKKILLADDSITIQKVIGLTFANEDVQLTVVDNGDEAVIKAKEIVPDLIIADVVMPGKDGYEVAYTVKHDPQLQHIPVLLLTGTFETFDEAMAKKVGADGFITKPFESQALIDKVNELISGAGATGKAGPSMADLDTPMPAAPVEEFAEVEEIQPVELEEITPVESIEPVADLGLEPVEPVEEDPMAGFGHLQPDSSESSFADVSFDEAPKAQAPAADDFEHDLPAEPEEFIAPAAAAEVAPVAPPPAAPSVAVEAPLGAAASGEPGGWNMSEFSDYQAMTAAGAPATPAPAPAAPVAAFEPVALEEYEPVETEPMAVPEPIDMSAPAPVAAPTNDWIGEPEPIEPAPEPSVEEALFGTTSVETPVQASAPEPALALDQVADMYPLDETPAAAPAPVASDESTAGFALDGTSEAPARKLLESLTAPASEAAEPADVMFAQDSAAEPPIVDHSVAAQARVLPPRFEDMPEPAAAAPAETPEAFALDSAAEPPSPAVAAATRSAAPEIPPVAAATPAAAPEVPPVPPAPVAAPAPLTVGAAVPAATAPGTVDTSALEAHLAGVLNQLADRTGKQVETLIQEAINKAAPGLIEKLVQKALADATEKILNETIGRLRNP